MSLRYDAMIFDLDGLMVDTEHLYWRANRELAARWGRKVTDQTLRKLMGRGVLDSMRIYAQEVGIPETPEVLRESRGAIMLGLLRQNVQPMPGLMEILRVFRGRLKLAIATSCEAPHVEIVLSGLGLQGWFAAIQTGETVQRSKPDPEIYLKAMARLGVAPERSIVLEDSLAGALAGKNAGAYVIAVPSVLTAQVDFSFADTRCASLHEATVQIERVL